MSKTGKDKAISVRLSQEMLEALDARAVLDEKDRTQVIREAIAQHLGLSLDPVEERIATLEERVDELSRLVAVCLERFTGGNAR
ncbi:ribbon-helix-helix protein, CopG family [Aerosakkonemataceae cyanobacterium BLCC-F50]|uniref:Ribbon-helix-helix protein, CopG family n=1 Tax=Floridaenema flaviceps BLCC-F50 TaxID=3153642 RepID=A0ABV4XNL3_9CYAN